MRSAKEEVLWLPLGVWTTQRPSEAEDRAVIQGNIPPVMDSVLGNYYMRNIANAMRDADKTDQRVSTPGART